jgi:hypothetical protein
VLKPSVNARFGEVSASIAIVLIPDDAKEHARVPAINVFPTPPFPVMAILIFPLSYMWSETTTPPDNMIIPQ